MVVEGIITGLHRSPYHGTAVEFADHRAYVAGDDLRHIDWKVYGRLGRFVIKKFEEETNLRAHILLDCSESMRFSHAGSMSKYEYGGTLAASLAYLLNRQLDSVGLTLFDSKIRQRIPPSTGKNVLNLIGEIMEETAENPVAIPAPILPGKTNIQISYLLHINQVVDLSRLQQFQTESLQLLIPESVPLVVQSKDLEAKTPQTIHNTVYAAYETARPIAAGRSVQLRLKLDRSSSTLFIVLIAGLAICIVGFVILSLIHI